MYTTYFPLYNEKLHLEKKIPNEIGQNLKRPCISFENHYQIGNISAGSINPIKI